MTVSLPDQSDPGFHARVLQKLIHLYLLIVVPALFWIGVAGLVGNARLPVEDATTYGFMLRVVSILCMASAGLVWMIRAGKGSRLIWIGLLLIATVGVHVAIAGQPTLLGSGHSFVNVATGLVVLAILLACLIDNKHPLSELPAPNPFPVTAVAIIGTCISVMGAYWMVERDLVQAHGYAKTRAGFVSQLLQAGLEEPRMVVQLMTDRWNTLDMPPGKAYVEQEFKSHISTIEAIKRFTVIQADGQLGADFQDGNTVAGDLEQAQQVAAFGDFLGQTNTSNQAVMSIPGLVANKPQIAFVAARINSVPNSSWLVATVNLNVLVKDAFIDDIPPCCFAVTVQAVELFRSDVKVDVPAMAQATHSFPFEKHFVVNVDFWKERLPGEVGLSYYPFLVLVVGLIFTFFTMVSSRLAQVSIFRARLLFDQSRCDPLTGLPNRRVLQEELERLCQSAAKGKGRVGLMFIDLRGMRLINDSLGHEVADQLLLALSKRLQAQLPEQAVLARLDGGEFVVTLQGIDDDSLTALAERVLNTIALPLVVNGRELAVSAVIGMSSSSDQVHDPMQLVREADLAMISAKANGQTSWAYYQPSMGEASELQLILSQELHAALTAGELSMAYQPLVCTETGKIVAMEALVRWTHHARGPISPAQFIPMAEETGQIVELTQWTLERVCEDAKSLFVDLNHTCVPIAVNISPAYFQRENFIEQIKDALARTGVTAKQLQLEVTEGLLLKNQSDAIQKLQALGEMGIVTSLDDFGTGYSSLSYLKNLPIQKIKIDRSFVLNVTDSYPDAEIVRGVINIAHQLGLLVVIEGVETPEQAQCLVKLHADQLQGYVFSKAISVLEMRALLQDYAVFKQLLGMTDFEPSSE